jgi:hypothetical protein
VEVNVTIAGRGRVTTKAKGIDCPERCFLSLEVDRSDLDAGVGVSLFADPSPGARFVGWSFQRVVLGTRGRGPEACSPMKREGAVLSDARWREIVLPFGETRAWAPPGREAECAAFAAVPVGYSVTATFAEAADGDASDGTEVLYTTPAPGALARELGLVNGRLYWRFEVPGDLRSGIASGSSGDGGVAEIVLPPTEPLTGFDVDRHVVYQRASAQSTQGFIAGGGVVPGVLNGLTSYACDAFASHNTMIYCRITFSGGSNAVYAWAPFAGASTTYVYSLPSRGSDLAVDDDNLYYSEDPGVAEGAIIKSAPRPNGEAFRSFPRVVGQTSPRDLRVGSKYLYWLDGVATGAPSARIAPKAEVSVHETLSVPGARLLAPDPDDSDGALWVGVFRPTGGFSIVRASLTTTREFRVGLPALAGLAVDASYVYWTQGDARVYRAPKWSF